MMRYVGVYIPLGLICNRACHYYGTVKFIKVLYMLRIYGTRSMNT